MSQDQVRYWAVIGDVVASRTIEPRAPFQAALERLLCRLSQEGGPALASGWTVTVGDEFQALFASPDRIPVVLESLAHGLSPHRLRFGLGYGTLSTPLRPRAVGMDGPCFHAARAALDAAKKSKKPVTVASAERITDIWALALIVIAARTRRQGEIIEEYKLQRLQARVATRLGVTPGTISRELARSHFAEVEAVLGQLGRMLQEVGPQ